MEVLIEDEVRFFRIFEHGINNSLNRAFGGKAKAESFTTKEVVPRYYRSRGSYRWGSVSEMKLLPFKGQMEEEVFCVIFNSHVVRSFVMWCPM